MQSHVFYGSLKKEYPLVSHTEGSCVYTMDGKRYIDCAAGAAVTNIGHSSPEVIDAMVSQIRQATYVYSSQFSNKAREELADLIISLSPEGMSKVFFCSGGSEAVESIIKIARQYQVEAGRPSKYKIISRWQSYHGNTLGTLSVGGRPSWREPFEPLLLHMPHIAQCNCYHCPFGLEHPVCGLACAEDLERTIKYEGPDTVAAFLLEPIIGTTATCTIPAQGYMERIREICDKYDILLCCDEVITGLGRTGKNFAVDHFGITPDLISVAKGLGGGYVPIGAVIAHEKVVSAFMKGSGSLVHSFTFGSMPLSCSAANAVLKHAVKNKLVRRAAEMGDVFACKLENALLALPAVGEIRHIGMLFGIELVMEKEGKIPFPPSFQFSEKVSSLCFQNGLIILSGVTGVKDGISGEALQLSPPFIITEKEMDESVEILKGAIEAVTEQFMECNVRLDSKKP